MPVRVLAPCVAMLTILGLCSCAHHTRSARTEMVTRGQQVYVRECQACHGARGSGTQIGPSLRNERLRRTYASVRSIVGDPQPPMPKLFPSRMTQNEVDEVSAYVESL